MSVVIKSAEISYKDPENGRYVGLNVLAEKTTTSQINAINAAGAEQIADIEAKSEEAQSLIPSAATLNSLSNSMATAYSSEKIYKKDEYCMHEYRLYKALADIDTPEAWDESKWQPADLDFELRKRDLKFDGNEFTCQENELQLLFDSSYKAQYQLSVPSTKVGSNIDSVSTYRNADCVNVKIPIPEGTTHISFEQYKTGDTSYYGSAIIDTDGIILKTAFNNTVSPSVALTIPVVPGAAYFIYSMLVGRSFTNFVSFKNKNDNELSLDSRIKNFEDDGGQIKLDAVDLDTNLTLARTEKELRLSNAIGKTIDQLSVYQDAQFLNTIIKIPNGAFTVTCYQFASTSNCGSCFLDADGLIVETLILDGNESSEVKTDIPSGAAYFVYAHKFDETGDTSYVIFNGPKEIPLGLHVWPMNQGAVNAIKNIRQFTDISWSSDFEMPRASLIDGVGPTASTSGAYRKFEDKFEAGESYIGAPYSDTVGGASDYRDNIPRMLGISRPLDVFASSIKNDKSIQKEESVYSNSGRAAAYYGISCTALTAYAFGLPFVWSGYYLDNRIYGLNQQFALIEEGARHTLDDIRLLDVLQTDGHCAIVSDIIKNESGHVEYLEISEATRGGAFNRSRLGTQYGGKCRRYFASAEEIYSMFADYVVLRYNYISKVKHVASQYSSTEESINRLDCGYFPIMPYKGNRSVIFSGGQCLLIFDKSIYTHVIVRKNGDIWNEDSTLSGADRFYSLENLEDTVSIVCDNDSALYTATLAVVTDNEIITETVPCEWATVVLPEVSMSVSGSYANFTVVCQNGEFKPWFVNTKNLTTLYGSNYTIYDNFTQAEAFGMYTYIFSEDFKTINNRSSAPSTYLIGLKSDKYGAFYVWSDGTNSGVF